MIGIARVVCSAFSLLGLTALSAPALADGRDWNDGAVINSIYIRTTFGHFNDYMHYLATTWKTEQEAMKKAGLILSYRVVISEPHSSSEPDIILITEFKNWAARDHLGSKIDAVDAQIEGSLENSNKNGSDRDKIRSVLGSRTDQEALLR